MDLNPMRLNVRGLDLNDEELAAASRNLQDLLLELDVDDVRPASDGPAPAGAKAGDAIAFGTLLVTVAPPLVKAVIEVVASWLRRQPQEIEVEIAGNKIKGVVTAAQRDAIVAAYLAQNGVTPPAGT
ncbi:hypothetical protein [Actinoplanes sp. NBRC 103695]|uniref:hypothetical protein n=1 Tax=Actinoplanes sp. NBRC 103695 TaxID=3032202 RepID=UPI0024A3A51D|nr:hypothetical protein [Actinoplanes sp. NBRC 103695]GLY97307.1 hypothetical protein Acsp02_45610 [Actinoplanes sp. NBRC 103695]